MPDCWCQLVTIRMSRPGTREAYWLTEKEVYLLRDLIYTKRIESWMVFETGAINRNGRNTENS